MLRAAWPRVDVTTVDVSIKAPFTQQMLDEIAKSQTPAAQYIAAWSQDRYYMWDELAACAWLDPTLITKEKLLYMDVDLSHGPSYGDTLTWTENLNPTTGVRLVHAQVDLDLAKVPEYVCSPHDAIKCSPDAIDPERTAFVCRQASNYRKLSAFSYQLSAGSRQGESSVHRTEELKAES